MSRALPALTPKSFLRQLPEVHDLADNDECPICVQKYVPTKIPALGIIERLLSMGATPREPEPIEPEHAVHLPCNHVLGSECIKRWISPAEGAQNTCPYCVQQLFTPVKYPVSNHPLWDTLIDRIGCFGFTLSQNGRWLWNRKTAAAAIAAEDLLVSKALARKHASMLRHFFTPDDDMMVVIQMISAARLTVHLREAVLYLQLQSNGFDLPAIEEVSSETPFVRLEKHQEDALFDHFEQRDLFDNETTGRSHRKVWDYERKVGFVPVMSWKDDTYYWGFA